MAADGSDPIRRDAVNKRFGKKPLTVTARKGLNADPEVERHAGANLEKVTGFVNLNQVKSEKTLSVQRLNGEADLCGLRGPPFLEARFNFRGRQSRVAPQGP